MERLGSVGSSEPDGEPMETDPTFTPTDYQLKVYDVAMRRNSIAVSENGDENYTIAIMMINEVGKSLKNNDADKRLIAFLVPTVHLVHELYKELKLQTQLDVGEYFGALGVDDWNIENWEKEINEHNVMVMTPQILLDALRKAYLSFEVFCFVILDECHRATGNHPYARIMKDFYVKSTRRPKIFGMTASPTIRKGSTEQIRVLEGVLDSQVYTVENRVEHEEHITLVETKYKFYDPIQPPDLEMKENLESTWAEFDAVLLGLQQLLQSQYKDADDKYKALLDRFANDRTNIMFCLENLGLLCAYEAVKICMENAPKVHEECELYKESLVQYGVLLKEILSIIEGSQENKKLLNVVTSGSDALAAGHMSSKLKELLEIFRLFGEDTEVLCLLFVERIVAAEVIERVLKKITAFSHFNISYMTRSNSSHGGKVNLLFSTDLLDEGSLVAKCSSVIHFDLPRTLHSYVQTKGLVCPKNSQYIIMLERRNTKQMDHMLHLSRSESSMKHSAFKRDSTDSLLKAHNTNEVLPYVVDSTGASVTLNSSISLVQRYVVDSTGASVTLNSSISLVQRYCDKLPRYNNITPKPNFESLMEGNLYRCKLILPPNSAFHSIVGPVASNSHVSKQLVCLDACKKLHQMGALSDHLVPSQKDFTINKKAPTAGPGTTRRKELHGSIGVRMLSGTGDELENVTFNAYKLDFSCSVAENKYSSFALLLEGKLDNDVSNTKIDLFLRKKFVKAFVSSCGQIHLDARQVVKAKCFQELIFNGLFGKLFFKSSGLRQFLLQTGESYWHPSNMYLLLPLEAEDIAIEPPLKINWAGIDSCVSTVEFLKKNARLNLSQSEMVDGESPACAAGPVNDKFNNDIIHLADRSTSVDSLKEMVVVAIHTGKIYSILEVVENTSAESPFEANVDESYSSYADYFLKKYGIALKHPQQPLLLLKQSHNSHNLLVDFSKAGLPLSKKRGVGKNVVEKPLYRAHIPPELLVGTDITTYVLKSFYLLPSIMHRLESLMLASQLKEEISHVAGYCNISSSLILEALTTQRCNESFSMERLELLGDSVLKYAVSCHLYLKNPKKHEGQLSSSRSRIICNATLYKLGTDRKLQEYVLDSPFDSRRWTAPGQCSIWPSPCSHGLDTREVPLESRFSSEDITLMIGKTCDKGHRWMVSKTISDCVEALIGAYHVAGGLTAAVGFMKWIGIEAEVEPSLIYDAVKVASLYCYAPKAKDISILESKLGYNFSTKGLLLEAITHDESSEGVGYCYQRLEFLGDAVLDVLITCHLYENHRDIDPGELTDLRAASVNNDNFALASVRRNLHPHLQHSSVTLEYQISEFVGSVSGMSTTTLAPDIKGPKVLGDLVESIAGAVLIDSKLNLDQVWEVFKPILSPIVTPDKLDLPPSRELTELCDSLGYFIRERFTKEGDVVHAELKLQLKDALLDGQGSGPNNKAAKGMAALQLLEQLKLRGIKSSKRRILDSDDADPSLPVSSQRHSENCGSAPKRRRSVQEVDGDAPKECRKADIPVVPPIEMKKGGPRTSLYSLCKKLQWPLPTLDTKEQKSRSPIEFGGGTKGFCSFESHIRLTIPDFGQLELTGAAKPDKKSSFDSAALLMLYELERRGKIRIEK